MGSGLMNSEVGDRKTSVEEEDIDVTDDDIPEDTVVMTESPVTDNVGDVSVEINVEELIAEVEAEKDKDAARKKEIRQRLEDLAEKQSFEDTYALDLDDD